MNNSLPMDLDIIRDVVDLARKAGSEIMELYSKDFSVFQKRDKSPLTEADLASHNVIFQGLKNMFPNIPILSEESPKSDIKNRFDWKTYWLIDPLDGTKEFINKNGEFTVNIALIYRNRVVFGVVESPALGVTYYGSKMTGSFKLEGDVETPIEVCNKDIEEKNIRIIGSRSHKSSDFAKFIANYPNASIIEMGSSLKLCLVAEGLADLYPRFGPTCEWDTAAAQAVVEGAGGSVVSMDDGMPLSYNMNRDSVLNPYFLASR